MPYVASIYLSREERAYCCNSGVEFTPPEDVKRTTAGCTCKASFPLSPQTESQKLWATVRALAKALGVRCAAFEEDDSFTGESEPKKRKGK